LWSSETPARQACRYCERAAGLQAFETDAKVRHAQLLVKQGKYEAALLRRAPSLKPRDIAQPFLDQVERAAKGR
jgi:hypothetical protein